MPSETILRMDIAIAVFIALFTCGLAYMGVHVTLHPPDTDKAKWWWKIGFGLVAAAICVLVFIQTRRNGNQQATTDQSIADLKGNLKDANDQLTKANAALAQSSLQQSYMQGQLNGLSLMVAKNGSDNEGVVTAIGKIAKSNQPSGVEPPAIERLTNSQLKSRVIDFANQLRQMSTNMQSQQRQLTDAQMTASRSASTTDERNKVWNDYSTRTTNLFLSQVQQIQSCCVISATEYRDEIVRRLGPENPADRERFPFTFWMGGGSMLGNPNESTLNPTAAYLEFLARKLN